MDHNLGYLIQQVTNDSTTEILGYIAGVASFVLDDLAAKSKATWVSKEIILFYKETPITYRIKIEGTGPAREAPFVNISVSFPKNVGSHNMADILNAVTEQGLGLDSSDVPPFERPELKTPRCLRDVRIMQNVQREKDPT